MPNDIKWIFLQNIELWRESRVISNTLIMTKLIKDIVKRMSLEAFKLKKLDMAFKKFMVFCNFHIWAYEFHWVCLHYTWEFLYISNSLPSLKMFISFWPQNTKRHDNWKCKFHWELNFFSFNTHISLVCFSLVIPL